MRNVSSGRAALSEIENQQEQTLVWFLYCEGQMGESVRLEWGEAHTETTLTTEGVTVKTEGNLRPKSFRP